MIAGLVLVGLASAACPKEYLQAGITDVTHWSGGKIATAPLAGLTYGSKEAPGVPTEKRVQIQFYLPSSQVDWSLPMQAAVKFDDGEVAWLDADWLGDPASTSSATFAPVYPGMVATVSATTSTSYKAQFSIPADQQELFRTHAVGTLFVQHPAAPQSIWALTLSRPAAKRSLVAAQCALQRP
jgi:hypothetical protein